MKKNEQNLIWIDLEMTGLAPERDRIVEIATIVTDSNLETIAEGPVFAIHQPPEILALMNKWVSDQHTHSGLVARIQESTVTAAEAERETLAFLSEHVPAGKSPMCGNSICLDRRFLYEYMPTLEKYFHYRHIDVSTIKELAKRWKPKVYHDLEKDSKHLALSDIRDSIAELQYYRKNFISI